MRERTKGIALSLVSALFVALFFVPYKAVSGMAPTGAVVLAMLLSAAVVSTLLSLRDIRRGGKIAAVEWRTALVLGLLTVVGNLSSQAAVREITPGLVTTVMKTEVLMVAVLALLFLREIPARSTWFGLALALFGFAIMRLPDREVVALSATGLVLALGAALAFASMHVWTRGVISHIRPVSVNALRLWLSVAVLFALPTGREGLATLGVKGWGLCAACAILGPVLGRVAIMWAVRFVPAAESTLYTMVTPLFAYALGFLFFEDVPAPMETAGASLIMLGVLWAVLRRPR